MSDQNELTGDWDYGDLPANVHLGRRCFIERKNSFRRFASERDPGLLLGDDVYVYTWTEFAIEADGVIEIGDGSVLVGAVFMCAESIRLGRRVVVSYNVTIADCDFHPRDPDVRRLDAIAVAPESTVPRPKLESRPVVIEDDVRVGIGAVILKGVHIGAGATIGAGAVVTRDVPAGSHAEGNPATISVSESPSDR
jgi:acetyltransferase-like isoleucine patch superfamily enzyme